LCSRRRSWPKQKSLASQRLYNESSRGMKKEGVCGMDTATQRPDFVGRPLLRARARARTQSAGRYSYSPPSEVDNAAPAVIE
ncbi:hypothetical protein, partial [Novipirellula maiorica]|uniref:hypothetical protein n=1 Tax=Novipirellula maiorica TaxID=1265734 RepID=UPI001F47E757